MLKCTCKFTRFEARLSAKLSPEDNDFVKKIADEVIAKFKRKHMTEFDVDDVQDAEHYQVFDYVSKQYGYPRGESEDTYDPWTDDRGRVFNLTNAILNRIADAGFDPLYL